MHKISIIIPLFNKGKSIKRTLNSVKEQVYTNWECVIVNDGSTDNSVDFVKPFLDDSRFVYYFKKNGGVSSARNYGVDRATGEYVIFLDADDYLLPHALDILIGLVDKYNTNVSSANFYLENDNARVLYSVSKANGIISNPFRSWLFGRFCPRTGAALFSKVICQTHRFDETLSRQEDAASLFDIMREEKISFSCEPVMVYNNDNPGLSRNTSQLSKDFVSKLNFEGKSFWEKLLLGALLRQGLLEYSSCGHKLRELYAPYLKYAQYARFLVFLSRKFNKAQRYL